MAETTTQTQTQPTVPEGDFQDWTKKSSAKGATIFVRDVDDKGKTVAAPTDASDHDVDSHGPSFEKVPCHWTAGTSGNTSTDFANQTGITWYKLENTIGWTYQLTINTNSTYNYKFHIEAPDDLGLDVWQTWTTHEVTYTTFGPTVQWVSGK